MKEYVVELFSEFCGYYKITVYANSESEARTTVYHRNPRAIINRVYLNED